MCSLSFNFLKNVFQRVRVLHFDDVQFSDFFMVMDHGFGFMSKVNSQDKLVCDILLLFLTSVDSVMMLPPSFFFFLYW